MRLESSDSNEHKADSRLRSPLLNRSSQPVQTEVASNEHMQNRSPAAAADSGPSRKIIVGVSALVLLATAVSVVVPVCQRHYGKDRLAGSPDQTIIAKTATDRGVRTASEEIDHLFQMSADAEKPMQMVGLTADELRTQLQAALPRRESSVAKKTPLVAVKQAPPVEPPSHEDNEPVEVVKTVESPPAATSEGAAVGINKAAASPVAVKSVSAPVKEALGESEGAASAWLEPSVGEVSATAGSAASGSTKVSPGSKKTGSTVTEGASAPEVSSLDTPPKKVASVLPKPAAKAAISDMAEYNRLLASYFSKRQDDSKSGVAPTASEHPPTYDEWLSRKKQVF